MARFVAGAGIRRMALLPYNSAAGAKYQWLCAPFALADHQTQSAETMSALAELCRREGLAVQVGG
jgi:hypothetical protein